MNISETRNHEYNKCGESSMARIMIDSDMHKSLGIRLCDEEVSD